MTLATVDADGRPNARYVLVRGADERGLWFFTNTASVKGRELAAHPVAALVFGWLELHRQVRLRGPVEALGPDEVEAYFLSRPRSSRLASWASRQSEVIADRAELLAALATVEARFAGEDVPAPPWVGCYRVVPDEVEFWQGRAGPAARPAPVPARPAPGGRSIASPPDGGAPLTSRRLGPPT